MSLLTKYTATFPEGATLLFTGRVEVPLPDDDPVAFAILMDIIHGKYGVPRIVSLTMLGALALLVDKYQLQKAVSRYSGHWIDGVKRDIPQAICPDLFHWLSISWVFQAPEEFNHVTRILERESNGLDLDTFSKELNEYLPIPQIVTGTSCTKKGKFAILSVVQRLFRGRGKELFSPHLTCSIVGLIFSKCQRRDAPPKPPNHTGSPATLNCWILFWLALPR
jgi:hypothetical protein